MNAETPNTANTEMLAWYLSCHKSWQNKSNAKTRFMEKIKIMAAD